MNNPTPTDISILTQVVFKAFIEVNKQIPEGKDWEIINKATKSLWKNSALNLKEINDALANTSPFKGDEYANKE
jgi:hypothetical protein